MELRRFRVGQVAALLAALAACSTDSYVQHADREVSRSLREATDRELGGREGQVTRPEAVAPDETMPPVADGGAAPPAAGSDPVRLPEVLDLKATLALAVRQNREFLTRRETLYREGLSISLTRFQFGPQFASAVTYLWPRSEGGFESQRAGISLTGSQILPTGGTLGVSAGIDSDWPMDRGVPSELLFGSNVAATLTQPLLRGAGYTVSHEPLTAGERQFVYAIRDFELFRQDFTINIAQQFFQLTSRRKTLANEEKNLERATFDRKQAEALLQVGRKAELEVFLARRREIEAKDAFINATADYDLAVDQFKIQLGVPTTTAIDLADIEPPYEPVRFEVSAAIDAALHNRLDLITARQVLEDAERALRIADNALLPDLNLTASTGFGGVGDDLSSAAPDEWNSAIGLTFELPLQQRAERNSYRSTLIGLEQARRALSLREDQLGLEIRNAVRSLRSLEERIEIQKAQILQEKRAARVTRIRFEGGAGSNRDLLEAEQALVTAGNALIGLEVDHFVARLNLLRDMGVFFVDDEGMWR